MKWSREEDKEEMTAVKRWKVTGKRCKRWAGEKAESGREEKRRGRDGSVTKECHADRERESSCPSLNLDLWCSPGSTKSLAWVSHAEEEGPTHTCEHSPPTPTLLPPPSIWYLKGKTCIYSFSISPAVLFVSICLQDTGVELHSGMWEGKVGGGSV